MSFDYRKLKRHKKVTIRYLPCFNILNSILWILTWDNILNPVQGRYCLYHSLIPAYSSHMTKHFYAKSTYFLWEYVNSWCWTSRVEARGNCITVYRCGVQYGNSRSCSSSEWHIAGWIFCFWDKYLAACLDASLEFFIAIILPAALRPWDRLNIQQKWVPGIFPGVKEGRCVGLTTLQSYCADCREIWEPQPPGNLWVYPGL